MKKASLYKLYRPAVASLVYIPYITGPKWTTYTDRNPFLANMKTTELLPHWVFTTKNTVLPGSAGIRTYDLSGVRATL